MEISEKIRHLRKKLKLSQEEFSAKINISRSNLGNIETGNVGVTPRVISDICSAFNVSRDWLTSETFNDDDAIFANTFEVYINDVCQRLNLNSFGKRALLAYLQLSETEQDALAKFAELIVAGKDTSGYIEMLSAARGGESDSKKITTDAETAAKLDTLPDKSHDFD